MRIVWLVLLVTACAASSMITCTGCGKNGEEATGEKAEKKTGGYMETLARSHRKGREEPNLLAVRNELKQFQAMEGRWPKSLEEFVEWRGADLPELPRGREFDYDPETGKLEIVDAEEE